MTISVCSLAPNGPEKRGCRMRIRDLFIKIRDYETEKTTGAPAPAAPASLAPMEIMKFFIENKR